MGMTPSIRNAGPREAGYSLVELLVAMGMTTAVMGAALTGLGSALRTNDAIVRITTMNNGLRAAMDLMTRDLLQAGSGLPKGHVILIPTGAGLINRPGPPGSSLTTTSGDLDLPAVIPGQGLGPVVNGVATDIITILTADNNFTDVAVTAVTSVSVTVPTSVNIVSGVDRVIAGQLMMVLKGATSTLVQVTAVNPSTRVISFAAGDSLNLNQPGSSIPGNLQALMAVPPTGTAGVAATRVTRVRMISYYLDATTTPGRPRLVRRINNGDATDFDNERLGTAVAMDVEDLRFTYDLNDGVLNPGGVRFTAADLAGTGACNPDPCSPTQIRKINVTLTARSTHGTNAETRTVRNTLNSQVALRGMALVNEYQ
jgi:Tfp pilus assembly protein PilW